MDENCFSSCNLGFVTSLEAMATLTVDRFLAAHDAPQSMQLDPNLPPGFNGKNSFLPTSFDAVSRFAGQRTLRKLRAIVRGFHVNSFSSGSFPCCLLK